MTMELIKESIDYEQLLGEKTIDNVIKEECVIPDTQPDVKMILLLDAKPKITNKQVMENKVYIEGQIKYNVLYQGSEDEQSEVFNAIYVKEFSSYIEIDNVKPDMDCLVEYNIEHIECNIINERKIAIEGIVQLGVSIYSKEEFEIVKDISNIDDIQFLKNTSSVDKIIGIAKGELVSNAHIEVPNDKPEVGTILNCNVQIHKSDVRLLEGKVEIEAFTNIEILYKDPQGNQLCNIDEDVFVSKEIEFSKANQFMKSSTNFTVDDIDFSFKPNDTEENRIIDIECMLISETKIMQKQEIDMIEDVYSPTQMLKMDKKNYELNMMLDKNSVESIVRENIDVSSEKVRPSNVIMSIGNISITDKKILEDKVSAEGLLNVSVLYTIDDGKNSVDVINEELPFSCNVDIPGAKIDMEPVVKANLESLETGIEAGTIAIKGVVKIDGRVNYNTRKDFLIDVTIEEESEVKKKSSVTIYVVQNGDTLWKIAKKYRTTVEELKNINELDNDNIVVGQKLIIPGRMIM